MVFEVSANHELSQKNVKTMTQRCLEVVSRGACVDQIRLEAIEPVLEYYLQKVPPRTLANDTVLVAWSIMRQGSMLCILLNMFRSGILYDFKILDPQSITEESFSNADARENIRNFLGACRNDLYMTDDQLFSENGIFLDDTNTLSKAIALTDSFFERIGKIQGIDFQQRIENLRKTEKILTIATSNEDAIVPSSTRKLDLRLRVLNEMLETEKSYVADLEKLQGYAEELRIEKVISPESHAIIFANLDKLVDFQRRFLLQMESKLTRSVLSDLEASYEADIAQLFIENERGFSAYETFCPNLQRASETITEEASRLAAMERIMDPNVTLRAFLIKPIQRICKYPLLIRELLKQSSTDAPDRNELERVWEIVNGIAIKVNQKKLREENALAAEELFALVNNWKGLEKDTFGELLLHDTATIVFGENFKELEVFLFERLVLMCGKSKSMTNYLTGSKKSTKTQISVKGSIMISQIISLVAVEDEATLEMSYKSVYTELCTIKLASVEVMKTWLEMLQELVDLWREKSNIIADGKMNYMRRYSHAPSRPVSLALSAEEVPECSEPFKLKIFFKDDIFVTVLDGEIESLDCLKNAVLKKIKRACRLQNQPLHLNVQIMKLKYLDDQKDLITILDDADVSAALAFSPRALALKVFEIND